MKRNAHWLVGIATILSITLPIPSLKPRGSPEHSSGPELEDARGLLTAYQTWRDEFQQSGKEALVIPLGWTKGLSSAPSEAHGMATLDLVTGALSLQVRALPAGSHWDVWLVDNQPGSGRSVKPEPGDTMLRAGEFSAERSFLRFAGSSLPQGFDLDLLVLTPSGADPTQAGVLFGAPTLFQRLYARERTAQRASASPEDLAWSERLFRFLLEGLGATGTLAAPADTQLGALVERGRDLFNKETFNGNGRTCATCHPATNNLTIDPQFIATLPPKDPLFVAEFVPALAENFENPALMRSLGLILENIDGFEDLQNRFVMRGVPHTLGLSTSLTPAPDGADGTTLPPDQRTGWGGDGAPGGGTLRDFAIGAVTQHFTLTLARVAGVDFRLPSDEDLDALEAFQLSLGRQEDLNLQALRLRGTLPRRGKDLFLAVDTVGGTTSAGKCVLCHNNAGATLAAIPGANFNFNTGVENVEGRPADLPPDGGFGRTHQEDVPGFGNGTFNTPPLVEAADTGPFFHNNSVATLEEAVAFYESEAFENSPAAQFLASRDSGGEDLLLNEADIQAVSAFLRVINVLENIRSSLSLTQGIGRGGGEGAGGAAPLAGGALRCDRGPEGRASPSRGCCGATGGLAPGTDRHRADGSGAGKRQRAAGPCSLDRAVGRGLEELHHTQRSGRDPVQPARSGFRSTGRGCR